MMSLARAAVLVGLMLVQFGVGIDAAMPPPESLRPEVLAEPVQAPVDEPAFTATMDGVEYRLRPRYDYDIAGMVVSRHDPDGGSSSDHDDLERHIKVLDLCLLWGANAGSGTYRVLEFHNSKFACHASLPYRKYGGNQWPAFNRAQFANNSLLTDREDIARQLRSIRVGDQVRLRGYLVDYSVLRNGTAAATRVSGDLGTTAGNSGSAVVYVNAVELLAGHRPRGRLAIVAGIAALLAGVVFWYRAPLKLAD